MANIQLEPETNVWFCSLIIYLMLLSIYDYILQVIGLYTGVGQYGIMSYKKQLGKNH